MILRTLVWMLLLGAGLAAALWWQRDHPAVQRLLPDMASKLPPALTTPSAATAPASGRLRKCRSGSQVLYTDGACPAGSREEAADGGSVTVLPAVRPPAASAAAAAAPASAKTPLRRLAGDGVVPDQQERMVEQALKR